MDRRRTKSPLAFILLAVIPYSRPNLLLAFKPNLFFNELEKISRHRRETLEIAYRRAQQRKLINVTSKTPRITKAGLRKIQPFIAEKLKTGRLMVIFDIPEDYLNRRQKFRRILKEWNFENVQKSVWASDMDYRKALKEVIAELKLGQYVQLYESAKL